MGFKDLFIKPEEKTSTEVSSTTTPQPVPSVAVVEPIMSSQPQTVVAASMEIVNTIWESIIQKNLPGPDYLELRQGVASLSSMPLSEVQKYEAAFNLLKSGSPDLTKQVILNSIDTYLGIVEQEKALGLDECQKKKDLEIKAKQAELSEIDKKIDSLSLELEELTQKAKEIRVQVQTSEATLNEQQMKFEKSIDTVLTTLREDKEKINNLNI